MHRGKINNKEVFTINTAGNLGKDELRCMYALLCRLYDTSSADELSAYQHDIIGVKSMVFERISRLSLS